MPKAECWWCGDPQSIAKHGMIYLHQKCFDEITDANGDIEAAMEFARGERPRVLANGDKQGYEALEKYLVEMQSFRRRFENTKALIQKLGGNP